MTIEETKRLLRVLGAAYQGSTIDADVIAVWSDRLEPWAFDVAMSTAVEWVDNEPRFPRVSEFLSRLEDQSRRHAASRALTGAPCTCEDGWVEVETEDGTRAYRPCARCRPATYELWAGGHFAPDHSCGACEDRRKGRR